MGRVASVQVVVHGDARPACGERVVQRPLARHLLQLGPLFEFTESIQIQASLDRAWRYLVDIEQWWVPSNPEHDSLEILGKGQELDVGTRIRIREKIAGIPGEALGEVTELSAPHHITWKADLACYRLWGIPLRVTEGVRWSLVPSEAGVKLSATVWAIFPCGLKGRLVEWLFKGPLQGETKDRRHAQRELEHIKKELEHPQRPGGRW